jgi:hypothetical protein
MNIPYQTIKLYNSNSLTEDHISASIPFILSHFPKLSACILESILQTHFLVENQIVKFLSEAGFIHLIIFIDHPKNIIQEYTHVTEKATSTKAICFWLSSIKMGIHYSKRS